MVGAGRALCGQVYKYVHRKKLLPLRIFLFVPSIPVIEIVTEHDFNALLIAPIFVPLSVLT